MSKRLTLGALLKEVANAPCFFFFGIVQNTSHSDGRQIFIAIEVAFVSIFIY